MLELDIVSLEAVLHVSSRYETIACSIVSTPESKFLSVQITHVVRVNLTDECMLRRLGQEDSVAPYVVFDVDIDDIGQSVPDQRCRAKGVPLISELCGRISGVVMVLVDGRVELNGQLAQIGEAAKTSFEAADSDCEENS